MKRIAKSIMVTLLAWQVRRLQRRHNFRVVAVAGSIGKTSTKHAIANVLSARYRVRYQAGNYNDIVTVPLVYFGQPLPSLLSLIDWMRVLWANERQIWGAFPWDVVVLELGTDGPDQLIQFGRFVHADYGVVTAIAPEHMEFFGTIDAVAKEELSIAEYSRELLVNGDLCDEKFVANLALTPLTYGTSPTADYCVRRITDAIDNQEFSISKQGRSWLTGRTRAIAKVQLYSIAAAAAVAERFGLDRQIICNAIARLKPISGRLQLLSGQNNTTIIDDTYNASPEAVKAALTVLYGIDAPQKIALLGTMNELGNFSPQAHEEVGNYCDAKQLALIVTLGTDANKYLAAVAETRGCTVIRVSSPYDAAEAIRAAWLPGAVILAKGSQNGVFAEEAVKQLLANPDDSAKLVRQSPEWLAKKARQFPPT